MNVGDVPSTRRSQYVDLPGACHRRNAVPVHRDQTDRGREFFAVAVLKQYMIRLASDPRWLTTTRS